MTIDTTICLIYFRSLGLANLSAALYSLSRQDFSAVDSVVVVDNNTTDSEASIRFVLDEHIFPVPVNLFSYKHGDASRTHSWSTNVAVRHASTPWVFFTRADYLLDFDIVRSFVEVAEQHGDGFISAHGFHLAVGVDRVEQFPWRQVGAQVLRTLPGVEVDYTKIDSGVWMAQRSTFEQVGGLDESLTAWGHAQTHFQHKLYEAGVPFLKIPEVLFWHPIHAASRDIDLAHQQLRDRGVDVKHLWSRYEGISPYS